MTAEAAKDWSGTRILVTGAAGFLGRRVAELQPRQAGEQLGDLPLVGNARALGDFPIAGPGRSPMTTRTRTVL